MYEKFIVCGLIASVYLLYFVVHNRKFRFGYGTKPRVMRTGHGERHEYRDGTIIVFDYDGSVLEFQCANEPKDERAFVGGCP